MSARHVSRSVVLQALFVLDAGEWHDDARSVLGEQLAEARDVDTVYAEQLLNTVLAKRNELDALIVTAAPQWPLDKIAVSDRNILRIGLSELLYTETLGVPPKVAINESIELAKEFGGDTSSKFVNGVLGTIYKDIGEPRKDEGATRKIAAVRTTDLHGAVVFAKHEDDVHLLFKHDESGKWVLPEAQTQEALVGVLREMLDTELVLGDVLAEHESTAHNPQRGAVTTRAVYYLTESPFTEVEGDAQWFKLKDAMNVHVRDDVRALMAEAIAQLAQNV